MDTKRCKGVKWGSYHYGTVTHDCLKFLNGDNRYSLEWESITGMRPLIRGVKAWSHPLILVLILKPRRILKPSDVSRLVKILFFHLPPRSENVWNINTPLSPRQHGHKHFIPRIRWCGTLCAVLSEGPVVKSLFCLFLFRPTYPLAWPHQNQNQLMNRIFIFRQQHQWWVLLIVLSVSARWTLQNQGTNWKQANCRDRSRLYRLR